MTLITKFSLKRVSIFIKSIFLLIASLLSISLSANNHVYSSKEVIVSNISQQKVFGKVIDKKTGETIPFCSISIEGTLTGTSSNEIGEFELSVKDFPQTLVISHINYQKQLIKVTSDTKNLTIKLDPLVFELEEVTITNKGDVFAAELAKKAFNRAEVGSFKDNYGKAYYRQKSKNGTQYSEFSEIIYDIKYSTEGISDWDILEGRYALKGGTVNNRNYTLLSRVLKSFQQNSEDLIFPFRKEIDRFYTVKTLEKHTSSNRNIAIISFKPKTWVNSPILSAEAYIDTDNFDLLKLTATLKNDDFKAVKFKDKAAKKKNYVLSYEMAFKKGETKSLLMDYMKVNQQFDYYKNDSLITNVTSSSVLSFFEHYTPNSRKKLGRQFNTNDSDWQKLNAIGYNKSFWEENAIVKRTPIEEEIIQSFERNNAFESIFLNSRQQISLTQSNISDEIFIKDLEKNILNYNSYNPIEKVYLHTDKDQYTNNEDIWFSAYITLGTKHHYSLASKVLHIDFTSPKGKIVYTKSIPIEQGRGAGNITVPNTINSGEYQLRAYTQWMRNFSNDFFFKKNITVVNSKNANNSVVQVNDEIDLQFFPEGGNLISNLKGRVAFKAIGKDGLGKNIKGKIVDSNNKFVLNFSSKDQGAGVFNLKPKLNERYTAILSNGKKINLPQVKNTGYSILLNNIDDRNIKVKIQASENLRGKKFYVTGFIHNEKYYQGKFEFGGKLVVDFEIPKGKLTTGLFTLTVFSEEGVPMAERIAFVNNNLDLNISTKVDVTNIKPGKKIPVEITVKDQRNWPVETDISIAVTDADKFTRKVYDANILTKLFFESELKGHIENPYLFFDNSKRSNKYRRELIMLTHGWRKINWEQIKNQQIVKTKKHQFEQGIILKGIARDGKKIIKNKNIKMVAVSNGSYASYNTKTDNDGRFTINNFNHEGQIKVSFNTTDKNGKLIEIIAEMQTVSDTKTVSSNFKRFNFSKIRSKDIAHAKSTSLRIKNDSINQFITDNKDGTLLNEVELKNQVKRTKKDFTNFDRDNMVGYNMVADVTVTTDHRNGETLEYILEQIPNLRFQSSDNNVYIRRNSKPVMWVIDGVQVFDHPEYRDLANIEKVEVLKSTISTAVYGPKGVNGVIVITTKKGPTKNHNTIISSLTIQGHQQNKEFYISKYSNTNKRPYKDYRTTLYWNPSIRTNKEGKATIYVENSEDAKRIQIAIEGLSKYGIPGVHLKTFGEK
jgi:TonB-dependent SusC/RagA subfamily outer membrane receptor